MKAYGYLIGILVLAALLVGVLLFTLPTLAAEPAAMPSSAPAAGPPPPPAEVLVALPVVLPDPAEIPPHLGPEQAAEYARRLTDRQAGPILAELERLQAGGLIAGFEVRPDLHGVAVKGAKPEALEALSRLPDATAVLPMGDPAPACAVAAAEALSEQVLGLSRMAAAPASGLRAAGVAPQATDPSINAYVRPG
ncbi:MAG: hypothetical protein ACK4WK_10385, partial [Anaerolineae bacterium]